MASGIERATRDEQIEIAAPYGQNLGSNIPTASIKATVSIPTFLSLLAFYGQQFKTLGNLSELPKVLLQQCA